MTLLLVENVLRHYGPHEVLRGASLRIERGDKIGVVGRNGGGKTTLLRVMEGEEAPDSGSVTLARDTRLGYVAQRPHFEPGTTVRAYVEAGLEEVHRIARELEQVGELLARSSGTELDRLVLRHGELSERMESLGGWETDRRVETVLSGIGLARELWEREASSLSGGERSRTALARELISVPDVLLLDEPTNHLDLAGIEWLEDYLSELRGAVLIVSHDRRLLSRVVTSIVVLEFGKLTRYPGNYPRYLELEAERFESAQRAFEKQQEVIRREESFIKKHMGSQRTAEARGRQKKLSHVERVVKPFHDVRRPVIRPPVASRGGELVLEAKGLTAGYGDRMVFSNVDLRVGRGERIGIVGSNGSGKSTLLKVVAGRMKPLSGELSLGHRAECGFYDQDTADLREDGTPFLELRRSHPQMTDGEIRGHLARFLFRGNDVDALVRGLSGGERARLCLAKLVLSAPSWLALDEPTNHLDLASRTALEEMLSEFGGALVCISHDREFLDGLCTAIVAVEGGTARRFEGNYSAWREACAREAAVRAAAPVERKRVEKAPARRGDAAAPARDRPRNPYLFKKLEEAIIALEAKREGLQTALADEAVYRDAGAAREAQIRLAEVERELEEKNLEWENWA